MQTIQPPAVGSSFTLSEDYETEIDGRTLFIPAGTAFTITEIDGPLSFEDAHREYGTIAFGAVAGDVIFHSPNDASGQSDRTYDSGTLWFDIDPEELELI
jgi:hypothetical protein